VPHEAARPAGDRAIGSFANVEVSFRRLEREDFALLSDWFARPHVEPWWREEYDLASIEQHYGPGVDGVDPTELFIVEKNGQPVGFAQRYLFDDNPEWRRSLAPAGTYVYAAGIDYLVGEETMTGHGFGPLMIREFVEQTWRRYPGISQVVVAVQQANRRSWRALEKAGFEREWAGTVCSDDPTDNGPSYVYVHRRPSSP
jgi:aminoglycoside 6'-N-acetyltransferase